MRYGYRFIMATLTWTLILVTFTAANQFITGLSEGSTWEVVDLFYQFPGWFGVLLPFAAFAGGLTASVEVPARQVAAYAIPVAALAYLLMAYVVPIAQHEVRRDQPAEVAPDIQIGPKTPSAQREFRNRNEANPPAEFSFSTDDPSSLPPRWITHLIQSKMVMALFALFAALIGQQVGVLTGGRSPPSRRNARWALGLLTAALFFVAQAALSEWLKADLTRSVLMGTWGCLIVPTIEYLGVYRLASRRQRRLHAFESQSVQ